MVRDRPSAQAYSGQLVRFRVAKSEYAVEGRTVRLWYAGRDRPPALVVTALDDPPSEGALLVVGVCGAPVVDGVKRGLWCDFSVSIEGASVRPAP